jgi:coproporphyrinogen III oxidase|tara:strand:+ start:540 stop:1382 length:843 start_codon:yes stop_codon:yes gene_type:complete
MINNIETKKKLASSWFSFLQNETCILFERLEKLKSKKNFKKFSKRKWKKSNKSEGGGTSYLMTDGQVFDKVGINFSEVSGFFKKEFRNKILGASKDGSYWASGISIVAHMKNPKIPALHFNTRFIVTTDSWFGGGMDATPSKKDAIEKIKMHKLLKTICTQNKKNYNKYKKWCNKYFYLPHRKESRGIGGIFFDYETKNWENNFKFVRELGLCFMDISKNVILEKINTKWSKKEKKDQYIKRGKYVEFNLLYDRGTKFGLNSGGNIESILMSLPPKAKWK